MSNSLLLWALFRRFCHKRIRASFRSTAEYCGLLPILRMPTSPLLPAFLQLGANGVALFNTTEIVAITRDTLLVTDQNRAACTGYISPDGQVYRILVHLRNGLELAYMCSTEELQYYLMTQLGAALQAHVLAGGQGNVDKAASYQRQPVR